jgi:geranylgeranyl transferase type-2 subunit beta
MVDVFHTQFGVAGMLPDLVRAKVTAFSGLSLLGYPGLVDLDPVYCMPADLIAKMGLKKEWKALERVPQRSF